VYISLFYLAPGVARRVSALGITQADNGFSQKSTIGIPGRMALWYFYFVKTCVFEKYVQTFIWSAIKILSFSLSQHHLIEICKTVLFWNSLKTTAKENSARDVLTSTSLGNCGSSVTTKLLC
jgi:hypothetical protein